MKEELCYVSRNMKSELLNSRSRDGRFSNQSAQDPFGEPLKRCFVLPDFHSIMRGFVKPLGSPSIEAEQVELD